MKVIATIAISAVFAAATTQPSPAASRGEWAMRRAAQEERLARSRAQNQAMNQAILADYNAQGQAFLQNAGNMSVFQIYQGLLQLDPSGGAMAAQLMQAWYMDRLQKFQAGVITPQELQELRQLRQLFGN